MEKADEDLLRKNHLDLRKHIAPKVVHVLEYLESNKIITDDMKERIDCENKTPGDKASKLLYLIRTRGTNAFQAVYDATVSGGLYTAADILKPENAPHAPLYAPQQAASSRNPPEEDSEEEELPDCWPPQDEGEMMTQVRVKSLMDSKMKHRLQREYDKTCSGVSPVKYYPLTHKSRGLCLIINNEEFKHLDKRDGTMKDAADLNVLFSGLGFDPFIQKNLTCEGMKNIIRQKVLGADHSQSDCFVLVILSHGAEGVVFGTDGQYEENTDKPLNCLEIKWLKQSVCAVRSLQNKPKLFFIQACRGKNNDTGSSTGSSVRKNDGASPKEKIDKGSTDFGGPESGGSENSLPTHSSPSPQAATNHSIQENSGVQQETDFDVRNKRKFRVGKQAEDSVDAAGETIPTDADLYLSFSTTEGYVSYRNTKYGTWYIQALVWVFSRFGYREDINGLMIKVADLVSKAEVEKKFYKQVSEVGWTMRKKFHFFPKLSTED